MGPGEAGTQPLSLAITELPSPNQDERPCPVDMLILHYTGMRSAREAVDRLRDPVARVSSHYVVDEDGTVLRLVTEDRRAWHAGVTFWCGRQGLNDGSIGIEIVNPGHEWGYRPFPPDQKEAVRALGAEIVGRHAILPRHVLGHSDVAPDRKQDPGELFDWPMLAASGIGVWAENPMDSVREALDETGLTTLHATLAAIGYQPMADAGSARAHIVRQAFCRHWHPALLDVPPGRGLLARAGAVLEAMRLT